MNLYSVLSSYQLLFSILHSMINKNENNVLIISITLQERFNCVEKLSGLFHKIIVVSTYGISLKVSDVEGQILSLYDEHLKKNDLDLDNFNDIYLCCPHNYFGIYLSLQQVSYNFVEDASGILSRPDTLRKIEYKISEKRADISEQYGLFDASSALVKTRIANLSKQKDGFEAENTVHFDIVHEILNLSQKDQKTIFDIFCSDLKIDDIEPDSTILLTQHFANLRILSFDEQIDIYNIFMDYFMEDEKVVIKHHPDDVMYYGILYPEVNIMQQSFMSEFLPLLLDTSKMKLATISSTGTRPIGNMFSDVIELDEDYEKEYNDTHKYFVILRVLKELGLKNLNLINTNNAVVTELNKTKNFDKYFNMVDEDPDVIIIKDHINDFDVDCVDNTLLFDETHIIDLYERYLDDIFELLVPIEIIIKDENNKKITQNCYFISGNLEFKQKIMELNMKVELDYCKKIITKEEVGKSEIEKKILQGVIDSMEKRLMYYIEKEKNEVEV